MSAYRSSTTFRIRRLIAGLLVAVLAIGGLRLAMPEAMAAEAGKDCCAGMTDTAMPGHEGCSEAPPAPCPDDGCSVTCWLACAGVPMLAGHAPIIVATGPIALNLGPPSRGKLSAVPAPRLRPPIVV